MQSADNSIDTCHGNAKSDQTSIIDGNSAADGSCGMASVPSDAKAVEQMLPALHPADLSNLISTFPELEDSLRLATGHIEQYGGEPGEPEVAEHG